MRRSRRLVLVVLISAFLLAPTVPASTSRQQTPAFRAVSDLIQVDVSVLDRRRQPVSGLAASDFTVLENGVPQTITAFTAVEIPDLGSWSANWVRDAPRDVQTNHLKDGRLFVLYIDDQRLVGPLMTKKVQQIGAAFVRQLAPSDRTAVVYAVEQQRGQEFTSDPARVRAAIQRFNSNALAGYRVFDGLVSVLEALMAAPGRRKSLVYVGRGEYIDFDRMIAATRPGAVLAQGDQWDMFYKLQNAIRRAQQANVNIYAIDADGLLAPTANQFDPGRQSREFMQILSTETGGRPIVNTNAPEQEVPHIFRENGSYYLLGYHSGNHARDGKYRRIEVKVNRQDTEVRARRGYFAPREGDRPPVPAPGAASAIADVLPIADLPLAATVTPFAHPDADGLSIMVALGVLRQPAIRGVEILMRIFNEDGRQVASQTREVRLDAATDPTVAHVLTRVNVPFGRYHFRFSARDPVSGVRGSVYADVEALDFRTAPLSLSGIVLSTASTPVAASSAILSQVIPIAPTTEREFDRRAAVTAFVRAYQGRTAPLTDVDVGFQVIDGQDAVAFEVVDPVAASRFAQGRAVDSSVVLPLQRLQPGPYLLRIKARSRGGADAVRELRFGVR